MEERNQFLSKTLFLKGLKCKKLLFLTKYYPNLREELTEKTEEIFQTGNEVNLLARRLFPEGREIPSNETISRQSSITSSLIKEGVENIFEASFLFNEIFVRTDILHKGEEGWEIYEVKSSTSQKDEHLYDVALQFYVLKNCGLDIRKVFLVHLNSDYARWGEIEIEKLFRKVDLTESVFEKQKEIEEAINSLKEVLMGEMPNVEIGKQCIESYPCEFKSFCWKGIPENSIPEMEIRWLEDKFALYRRGFLYLDELNPEEFNGNPKMYLEAFLEKKIIVNKKGIENFLQSLWYPMSFLDFETFQSAIPPFDGTRPYQQIPFQYSLHILPSKNGKLEHSFYLAQPGIDPRRELIEKLLNEIPPNSCVIVYNEKFEKGILTDLSELFPEFREKIQEIMKNLRDLMLPFKRKDYYHWNMLGSHSLKRVVLALLPELKYEELEIRNGEMAMGAYQKMCKANSQEEVEKIRKSLLNYCFLDTFSMVKLIEKLEEMVET